MIVLQPPLLCQGWVSVWGLSPQKSTFGILHNPDPQLLGHGDQRLDVKGFVFMKLTHRQTCIQEKVYNVKSSKLLLGMPAIQTLGLVPHIPGAFPRSEELRTQKLKSHLERIPS